MQGRRAEHNETSGWRCLGALVNHVGPFAALQTAVAGFLAMQCTCPILNWGTTLIDCLPCPSRTSQYLPQP
jgi:hypothetical protein